MKRQIKFRAWDRKHQIMLNEFGDGSAETSSVGVNKTLSLYQNDESWEIMQFTGFQDKEGVDIYEGDLMKVDKGVVYRVFFANSTATFLAMTRNVYSKAENAPPFFYAKINWVLERGGKVIGNIHENPQIVPPEQKDPVPLKEKEDKGI